LALEAPGWNGVGPDYTEDPSGWTGESYGYYIVAPGTGGGGGEIRLFPALFVLRESKERPYRIEIHDADGERLAGVDAWHDGELRLAVDEASEVRFSVAADNPAAAYLVRPNTVTVRDRFGFYIDSFQIQETAGRRNGDATYKDVFCQSAIAQLGEEPVILYEGAAMGVGAHVQALLDLQVRDNPITLGDIDEAILEQTTYFRVQDATILRALLHMQGLLPKAVAGHFWVDANRRLNWNVTLGNAEPYPLPIGGGLQGIEHTTDWSQLVNRVYFYGEGEDPATRLKLSDAEGQEEDYIDDADSIATYGLSPHIHIDRRYRYADSLVQAANRILEDFAEPRINVTINALDLAKSDEFPDVDDLRIGGIYRVVDPDQSIDTEVEVVALTIDLANPLPVTVELTNQEKRLGDLFGLLIDALHQPLDVDGDRYPTVTRNYSDYEPRAVRRGDTRWNTDENRPEMYDGDSWEGMGGGIWVTANTYAALPSASGLDETTLGLVLLGDDIQQIYKIKDNAWFPVDSFWQAETKAALPTTNLFPNSRGWVNAGDDKGMLCIPNPTGTGWDALNFFE